MLITSGLAVIGTNQAIQLDFDLQADFQIPIRFRLTSSKPVSGQLPSSRQFGGYRVFA
jgi:hypothetical protein